MTLAARFRERFGRTPRLFRAPGRINIIGEHTDYTGGFVMPAAIDRWCGIAAAPNGTRTLVSHATAFDQQVRINLDWLAPRRDWSDYIAGVAAQLMAAGITIGGADLLIESDVPIGSGMSSSAALEVAAAVALLGLADAAADPVQIARWAQAAENTFVGMPCGIMDQFTSANGRADSVLLLDCRTLDVAEVPLPDDAAFLIINSMVKHALVDGEYRARREDCETAVRLLDIASLRDIAEPDLPGALTALPGRIAKRARHVVSENLRVQRAGTALRAGDLATLGHLMDASHASLRDDMEVSIPEVDALVTIARAAPGVLGARMMGGGFGGSIIALVRRDAADPALWAIVARYKTQSGRAADAFVCCAVDGAAEIAA